MIAGNITARAVYRHPVAIARGFGVRALLRCLVASVRDRRFTFLELVMG